jgi:hypothetical protein
MRVTRVAQNGRVHSAIRRALAAVVLALALGGAGAPLIAPVASAGDATPPGVTAPVARLRTGSTVASGSTPFALAWSGADASGIRSWRLQRQVDGGSWETVSLPSPTADGLVLDLRQPHEYGFRVRATDAAGNTSAWATAPTFRVRRLSETTSDLVTTGPWSLRHDAAYLGGNVLRTGTKDATASLTFTGSQVAWFGTRAPTRGKAEVSVDGTVVATVDLYRATTAFRRVVFRKGWAVSGLHTLVIRAVGTTGHPYVDIDGFVIVDPPAVDPVLVGAGDVSSCSYSTDSATAARLDAIAGRVFVAGDVAYPNGTTAQLRDCYGPTWGRWRLRTSPVPGNHEYNTTAAGPYFAYFGSRAGTAGAGWYAYDLGTWRVYSLNSNCGVVGCGPGSPQLSWLAADLASHPRACVAAVWHHPRFSSGEHGNATAVAGLWATLDAAGADVVLNGHDHDYERFAPQAPDGTAADDGIREFVVGTGGAALRSFVTIRPNSVVRSAAAHGVLKLTLRAGTYDWQFVPVAGDTFSDSGTGTCH